MRCLNLILLLNALLFGVVHGSGNQELPVLEPQAMSILEKATSFLERQSSFEIQNKVVFDVIQDNGQRLQFERNSRLLAKRPNKLYVESLRDDGVQRKLWYDGHQVSILNLEKNAYAQLRAPETIDGMLDMFEGLLKEPHPLADLLYEDLGFLLTLPDEAVYVGPSLVSGRDCDHLAFRNNDVDWQLWVEKSDTPFIRKVVITYRNQPGIPQFVAYLHDWKITGGFNKEVFTFSPPEHAERLSILIPPVVYAKEGGTP